MVRAASNTSTVTTCGEEQEGHLAVARVILLLWEGIGEVVVMAWGVGVGVEGAGLGPGVISTVTQGPLLGKVTIGLMGKGAVMSSLGWWGRGWR